MKKLMTRTAALCMALSMALSLVCVPVFAEDSVTGIKSVTALSGATLTPKTPAGASVTADSSGQYAGAEQVEVTLTGTTAGEEYVILATTTDIAPTPDSIGSSLSYIDQKTATANGVTFSVYPKDIQADQTIYIFYSAASGSGPVKVGSYQYYSGGGGGDSVLYGDANKDGKVNGRDAARIQQHVAGWTVEIDLTAADANGDGKVNGRDAARIKQYVAGWSVTLGPTEAQTASLSSVGQDVAPFVKLLGSDAQIVIEDQTVQQGDTITVPVLAVNNPGVTGFDLKIEYDATKLTLTKSEAGDFTGPVFGQTIDVNPYPVVWSSGTEDLTGSLICTLTFQVKEDATGTAAITPSFIDDAPPYNVADEDVPFDLVGGTITIQGGGGGSTPATYTVTWKNEDGTVLETDIDVAENSTPSYDGTTPAKAADSSYTYTFKEWTPALAPVTADVTYTATYDATPVTPAPTTTYTVTWQNEDGTVLETDTDVAENSNPSYDGETPTKASDGSYDYTFKEWTPALAPVTADVTYTATYSSTPIPVPGNTYTVKWVNEDGTVLETDTDVAENSTPSYDGDTPTKAADASNTYTFKEWTPTLGPVTADVTYTATYDATPISTPANTYTVKWVNEDGTVLETDTDVAENSTPSYDGTTPTKAADANNTYTFKEWTPAPGPVTADVTYTATYDATPTGSEGDEYDITVSSGGNGTVTADKDKARAGDTVNLTVKPNSKYTFDKWNVTPSDLQITGSGTSYSFTMPSSPVSVKGNFKVTTTGCYVATAVYGSYDCPEVWTLRRFRDKVLAKTWYGRLFIRLYYALSPTAVRLFGDCAWFQNFFRGRLDQMVVSLQADGFASTPYQDRSW